MRNKSMGFCKATVFLAGASIVSVAAACSPGESTRDAPETTDEIVVDRGDGPPSPVTFRDLDQKIEIVVALDRYVERDHRVYYSDGRHDVAHVSYFSIIEPIEYFGRELRVRHPVSQPVDPKWTTADAQYVVRIAEELLEPMIRGNGHFTPGWFEIVREVEINQR